MDSEDELLCALTTVIIKRRKTTKKEKRENTGYGFSRFTEKDKNMEYHI